jgi:hypothetical protein
MSGDIPISEGVDCLLAMKGETPCEKIHYSLREGAKSVKLTEVIDIAIPKVASGQRRGSIDWVGLLPGP